MDEETIITLYDEETDTKSDFILEDMKESGNTTYLLISPAETDENESPDFEDDDEDEEDSGTVFLFKTCEPKNAEFTVIENDLDKMFITSMMSDKEYQKAVQLFMDSDRYDLDDTEGEEQ